MKATVYLVREHTKIKKLFTQFQAAGEKSKRRQTIAEKTIEELKHHTKAEEAIFYPAVQQHGGKELQEKVLEGIEEHRIADFMIQKLEQTSPEDETYAAKYKTLSEAVKHHLKEEEDKWFSKAKKALGEEDDRLGKELQAFEKQAEERSF